MSNLSRSSNTSRVNLSVQNKRIDVRELDRKAEESEAALIDSSEQAYGQIIGKMADYYLARKDVHRIILVSGPSASGKTTTSFRLRDEFKRRGLNPSVISLDNFFLSEKEMRCDQNGVIQYDSVHSVNLSLFNRTLWQLIEKGEARIPEFDFIRSRQKEGTLLKLTSDNVVILEGIHALNPILTYGFDYSTFFKISMEVDSSFYDDDLLLLSSRDVRFLRRTIRDFKHRGATLDRTYSMWPGVGKGEDLYIKPFFPYADIMLDTVHDYEPLVYKPLIMPMLKKLLDHPDFGEDATGLYSRMMHFGSIAAEKVPSASILQEFIG